MENALVSVLAGMLSSMMAIKGIEINDWNDDEKQGGFWGGFTAVLLSTAGITAALLFINHPQTTTVAATTFGSGVTVLFFEPTP